MVDSNQKENEGEGQGEESPTCTCSSEYWSLSLPPERELQGVGDHECHIYEFVSQCRVQCLVCGRCSLDMSGQLNE